MCWNWAWITDFSILEIFGNHSVFGADFLKLVPNVQNLKGCILLLQKKLSCSEKILADLAIFVREFRAFAEYYAIFSTKKRLTQVVLKLGQA